MKPTNIRFSHIAPIPHLDLTEDDVFHMTLGHLVQAEMEQDEGQTPYIDFYRNRKAMGCEILMDNSGFEIYQHGVNGGNLYTCDEMIAMGTAINADILVMTDDLGNHWENTVNIAKEQGPVFTEAGFRTMYVPQSEIGDLEGWLNSFRWAVSEGRDLVDIIALSIIGCPNAMGNIERDNKLQRYMARYHMMTILRDEGLLDIMEDNGQSLHFLGALDGWVGEIKLMRDTGFEKYIYSWDTSQAVQHGLLGIQFDSSPTGLIGGKNSTEVDFYKDFDDGSMKSADAIATAAINVGIINILTSQTMVR